MKSIKLALQSSETLLEFQDTWARDDGRDEIFQAYKASASLPVYSLVNTAVENVSVFFPSSDGEECFVISSKNAMRYSREMGSVWLGAEEASYGELYAFLTGESFYDEFTFFGQSDSGLVPLAQGDGALSEPSVFFLSSLNDNGRGSAPVVLIRISDSFFEEMLSGVTIDGAGASFIVNGSGSFISYYGGEGTGSLDDATLARLLETSAGQEADHFLFEGYQVNRVRSNFTDWTYYSVIPQQAIYQELNHVRTVIALAAAIIILLGLLLCYLLTKKNSKPLKLIIRSLTTVYDHGRFDPEDDFQFIENAVSALVASNLAYHEKEKDIGSKTDREVLWRLFLGEGIDTAAFQRDLENSSIRLAGTQFVTGYLHVHGLDNSKQSAFFTKSSLWALLSQLFPEEGKSVHPLVIDKSNLVFLAVFGQEEAASQFCGELSLRLEGLGKQIEKDTGWHLDFFLSEAMRLAENVQVGYQQCKDLALRVVKDSGKFVYTTQDLPAFQQIYRYTMDQELRLAQLLQYGTQEELQAFLDELFEQNLRKLQLSRLGKTALLAGALDKRFQFVFANESGCSGAALYRGKQGETAADIQRVFPYWFSPSFASCTGDPEQLPFDQHFLLSLIAPRKLYVSSAAEDLWSDPAAEFLGCLAASPAFEAAGVPGLEGAGEEPQLGQAYHQGNIGYHLRAGKHFLSREDWRQFAAYLFLHREK